MCAYVTIRPITPSPTPYHHARAPTDTLRIARQRHAVLCARPPLSGLASAQRHSGRACPSEARSALRTVSLAWAAAKPLARARAAPNAQWDSMFYKWCVDHRIQDMMYAAPH